MDDEEVDEAAHNVDDDAGEAHHNGDENEHKHPLLRAVQRFPGRQFGLLSAVLHCTNFTRIANALCQGHLSRWTAKKAKSRS